MSYMYDENDGFAMGDIPSTMHLIYEADVAVRQSGLSFPEAVEPAGEQRFGMGDLFSTKDPHADDWFGEYNAQERSVASRRRD